MQRKSPKRWLTIRGSNLGRKDAGDIAGIEIVLVDRKGMSVAILPCSSVKTGSPSEDKEEEEEEAAAAKADEEAFLVAAGLTDALRVAAEAQGATATGEAVEAEAVAKVEAAVAKVEAAAAEVEAVAAAKEAAAEAAATEDAAPTPAWPTRAEAEAMKMAELKISLIAHG